MTDAELREWIDAPERRAEVSAVEVTEGFLRRLDDERDRLHATITITPELALADARRADAARARGERSALGGLPIVVKDNIDVAGVVTSAGSRALETLATVDAPVIASLRAGGAIVLAKANMTELALGATTKNPDFGDCRNPWDTERIPGGSSGGSAVAVAADLCAGAVGSDTGGSVRIPAAITGVSGLRPSAGLISAAGMVETSWSLDTAGPFARSARQLRELLAVMADERPPRSAEGGVEGIRIAVPAADPAVDREVAVCVAAFADALADLGAEVVEFELPGLAEATVLCGRVIVLEAYAAHRGLLDRVGPDTRERLLLGADSDASEISSIHQRRREWERTVARIFDGGIDAVLTSTVPIQTPTIAATATVATTRRLAELTYPWSVALVPALSVPCGATADGLPIGAQLAAAPGRDDLLMQIAESYQRETDWHRRRPPAEAA